jgi:hypothetical protein
MQRQSTPCNRHLVFRISVFGLLSDFGFRISTASTLRSSCYGGGGSTPTKLNNLGAPASRVFYVVNAQRISTAFARRRKYS